ncbi:agglutinin-like [Lycium barbarum]|uniref:agglutinin-like n=1 Tax=Lycium barbarum TaxID=112863 RepID=UPI00293E624E|nr:agglutinin-like [Lycium barbarum]
MGRIRSFLKDVDSRKQTEQRVKNWAEEIRDLAEDADGIVEKFAAEINIDCPSEHLTGTSGTFGLFGPYLIVKSIKFHTNLSLTDTNFSFIMQGGVVVGFHGSSGLFLDAIGLYVVPARISLLSQ